MTPDATEWWFRPVSSAARDGAHRAVAKLFVSPNTVKSQAASIYRKLEVNKAR
ncbi:hypothetical protein [Ilumatobacter sp.]|uniref:hypothetical protein n=1 Tax=Ilumatobacter sp. TaxID=1967498 RepID=UPI003C3FAA7C